MNVDTIHSEAFIRSANEGGSFEVLLEGQVVFSSQTADACDHFIRLFSQFPQGTWRLVEKIRLWAKEVQSLHLTSEVLLALFDTLEHPGSDVLPEADLRRFYPQEYAVARFLCDALEKDSICTPQGATLTVLTATLVCKQLEVEEGGFFMAMITDTLRAVTEAVEAATGVPLDGAKSAGQRLLVHLRFLSLRILRRAPARHEVDIQWYQEYAERYPAVFQCVHTAAALLEKRYDYRLGTDERFYLLIHLVQLFQLHGEDGS